MMRLKYFFRGHVTDAGETRFETPWWDNWLQAMVRNGEEFIFFLSEETTDVYNEEIERVFGFPEFDIDRNEVVYLREVATDPMLVHSEETGHAVTRVREEADWRCLNCEAKGPGWDLPPIVVHHTRWGASEPIISHVIHKALENRQQMGVEFVPCTGVKGCKAAFHANDCPEWWE